MFVVPTLGVGGTEKQLVEIAGGLDRSFFEPACCCLGPRGPLAAALEERQVPVWEIGLPRVSASSSWADFAGIPVRLYRLIRDVRRFNPTIVHGLLYHGYVLGAVAGLLSGAPLIVSSRRGLTDARRRRGLSRLAAAAVNAWTDCVIANSQAVREDAICAERLSPGLVTVIRNGIEVDRYSAGDRERTRAELGLGSGPVAIVLANFIGYKGHGYFLEAWQEVCAQYPTATALLIGDGPLRAAAEAEAQARSISSRIRFLGLRPDVPRLLAAGDLLVHPSLEEGSSNAILEAMASGLPVVATTVGGTPEAVKDRETGYLVSPKDSKAIADAVLRILGQPDAGREMGRSGRRRAIAEFQLSAMILRYEAVYRQLLRDKGI